MKGTAHRASTAHPAITFIGRLALAALILVVLLILGTFLEAAAIIMIVTPLLLPVINAIGVDPVHFGIIMLTSFAVGGQTPPVGMTLFVGASIAKISIERLSIASIPYILTLVVMLVIIALSRSSRSVSSKSLTLGNHSHKLSGGSL